MAEPTAPTGSPTNPTTNQQPLPPQKNKNRYKAEVDPAAVGGELSKAHDKLARVVEVLEALKASAPQLTGELDKILCHVADVRP